MFEWLAETASSVTAAMVFFSIFLFGVVISGISLFFSGDDADDADGGDGDGDHDSDSGGGDADGESDMGMASFHGINMGLLSLRGLCLLAVGLGGVGFVVQLHTGKVFFSTAAGIASGYVFAIGILYLLRIFKSQQSNSLVDHNQAVGQQAVVTLGIPENGLGEIRTVISGSEVYKTATSNDGKSIPAGTRVKIDSVSSGSAVVSPINQQ